MAAMPRVLVTGAAGFIGRHLVPALQQEGYRVRAALRVTASGPWDEVSLVGDIGPATHWDPALDQVDHVVHLAALAHRPPRDELRLREAYHRVNAEGTWRLAEAARAAGVRRVVLLSSVAVTGSFASSPVHQETPPAPDTPYGLSKAQAEEGLSRCLAEGRTDWCILRPPLVYGPGNPGNMARLLRLLRVPLPLPLGMIENRRSFCFVGNLTSATCAVLTAPAASRQVFLVADAEVVSTPELLRLLGKVSGYPVHLLRVPRGALAAAAAAGDLLGGLLQSNVGLDSHALGRLAGSLEVDASGLLRQLMWRPPYTLEEGLRLTISRPT